MAVLCKINIHGNPVDMMVEHVLAAKFELVINFKS